MNRIVMAGNAEREFRELQAWWRDNRPEAANLLDEEVQRCSTLLASSPNVGVRVRRTGAAAFRRLVMPRTRHVLYYLHDAEQSIVYVISIWGAPRRGRPVLKDPRGEP